MGDLRAGSGKGISEGSCCILTHKLVKSSCIFIMGTFYRIYEARKLHKKKHTNLSTGSEILEEGKEYQQARSGDNQRE